MERVVDQVAEKRRAIWEKEPAEVKRAVRGSVGAFKESFFPALYATEDSRNNHYALVILRKVLLDPRSDVETVKLALKTFLTFMASMTFTRFGMGEAGGFLEDVAGQVDTVNTREELLKLIEELAFYVGRLNYWLDEAMPWHALVETYDKVK